MFDLVISGGLLCDGTGGVPRRADLAVEGERIAAIGDLAGAEAVERFDASGMTVMPGFIDVHTHSDWQVLRDPGRDAALRQGVTTEIVGACGLGLFPLPDDRWCRIMTGIYGGAAPAFRSCGEYLAALPRCGVNVAVQLAHSPLRYALCGMADRPLPLQEAAARMREAFRDGACGFSTGLAYFPAAFDDTGTVAALCRVAREFDVPFAVHQRTALRPGVVGFDPREEVLEFARRSGVRVQYSHYRTAPATVGKTEELLAYIRRGRAEGLEVTADFYPYPVGAGYAAVHLPMAVMAGELPEILARLREGSTRRAILTAWRSDPRFRRECVVLHAPNHPDYVGRSYAELAEGEGKDIPEFLLDLLIAEDLEVAYRLEAEFPAETLEALERDFIELLKQPFYMLGSDTLPGHRLVHPRSFGAFARALRLAVKHRFPMGDFARRAAGLPAETCRLEGRGVLRRGNYADLCVFRPEEVRDAADFAVPARPAEGMKLVTVNGAVALRSGEITGLRNGAALRRK